MLDSADIDALEAILFADPWGEDALDFFGLHGVVCAAVVGPVKISTRDIFRIATGQTDVTADEVPESFSHTVGKLASGLSQALAMGQSPELPEPEEGDPMGALANWCAGFVECFLEHEDQWLAINESETGDLMVPMLTLSGLFEDEDFEKARKNEKLAQEMADAIPDTLTDLYLMFHASQ